VTSERFQSQCINLHSVIRKRWPGDVATKPLQGLPLPGTIAHSAVKVKGKNAGDEPSPVVAKVLEGKGTFGYNAVLGTYGDMLEMGVLDPTKITRTAPQNAASVASLMLTSDCMISEAPAADKGGAGSDMGGGMSAWAPWAVWICNPPLFLEKARSRNRSRPWLFWTLNESAASREGCGLFVCLTAITLSPLERLVTCATLLVD
jgi:TCP-1/cpn60 chaperonin family